MNDNQFYETWHHYRKISLVGLSVAFVVASTICMLSLRENNLNMIRLRQDVYTADKQNSDISTALNNLRQYVFDHMNTNLSASSQSGEAPIQLVYSYNRAVDAAEAGTATSSDANQVYNDAIALCQKEMPVIALPYRAQCVESYITSHISQSKAAATNLPAKELYTYDFVSPYWTPDLAGWSLVATIILGILLIFRIVAGLIINRRLK